MNNKNEQLTHAKRFFEEFKKADCRQSPRLVPRILLFLSPKFTFLMIINEKFI